MIVFSGLHICWALSHTYKLQHLSHKVRTGTGAGPHTGQAPGPLHTPSGGPIPISLTGAPHFLWLFCSPPSMLLAAAWQESLGKQGRGQTWHGQAQTGEPEGRKRGEGGEAEERRQAGKEGGRRRRGEKEREPQKTFSLGGRRQKAISSPVSLFLLLPA